MIERRKFISGLISFVAAPAIVRAGNLMPVKQMVSADEWLTATFLRVSGMLDAQREINERYSGMLARCRWLSYEEAIERFPDRYERLKATVADWQAPGLCVRI